MPPQLRWSLLGDPERAALLDLAAGDIDPEWTLGLRAISGWGYFSPRIPKVGTVLPSSRHWRDGAPTARRCAGTSAIELKRWSGRLTTSGVQQALRLLPRYAIEALGAKAVVLLAGRAIGRGEDDGELLLEGAEVMAVWPI